MTEPAGPTSIAIPFHNQLTAEEADCVSCVLERALMEVQLSAGEDFASTKSGWLR